LSGDIRQLPPRKNVSAEEVRKRTAHRCAVQFHNYARVLLAMKLSGGVVMSLFLVSLSPCLLPLTLTVAQTDPSEATLVMAPSCQQLRREESLHNLVQSPITTQAPEGRGVTKSCTLVCSSLSRLLS